MQAIEIKQAIIEAYDIVVNPTDALVETSVLKQLIESAKDRVDELKDEAKALAENELAQRGKRKGRFDYRNHHYDFKRTPVYDLVKNPKKYHTQEDALYREYDAQQKVLAAQSAALTKMMKTIIENYPTNHPNIKPDDEKTSVSYID